jgi:hypothetical protein
MPSETNATFPVFKVPAGKFAIFGLIVFGGIILSCISLIGYTALALIKGIHFLQKQLEPI